MKTGLNLLVWRILTSLPAHAEITRGCAAYWQVSHTPSGTTQKFGHFEARAACKNRINADKCRSAAHATLKDCFRNAWNHRWNEDIRAGRFYAKNCNGDGRIGSKGYTTWDIKQYIENAACSWTSLARPFRVQVAGVITGDKKCGGHVILTEYYEIKPEMCG